MCDRRPRHRASCAGMGGARSRRARRPLTAAMRHGTVLPDRHSPVCGGDRTDDAAHRASPGSDAGRAPPDARWPDLDGVEHQFVEIPDLRVHVAQAGHGEPVLLLHGFGQHWWEWRDVLPALVDRYCVICPDLRARDGPMPPPSATPASSKWPTPSRCWIG
ncbi:MAG: alpha/beta fold hydrolase [Blastococcus sp.]